MTALLDSQDVQRDRRRKHLATAYDRSFVLSAELAAVLGELAVQITADPRPSRWTGRLREMGGAMHEAMAAIAALANVPAPVWPEFAPASVADGSWVETVVDVARPLDQPLQAALARGGTMANGEPLRDRLMTLLRDLDQAQRNVIGALRAARTTDELQPPSAERIAVDQLRARHRAELAALQARHRVELRALRHG